MIRQCRRCDNPFTVTPQRRRYCSDACVEAACKRRCERCGDTFSVPKGKPGHIKKHCSVECRAAANQLNATARGKLSSQRRSETGRTFVACIWPDCPRPQELISLQRCQAKRPMFHRHPECREAYRRFCHGGTKPRKGAELVCQGCGKPIGYRPASRLDQEYCGTCAYQRVGGYKPRTGGEVRICALNGCAEEVWVATWKIKKSKTGNFYCTRVHAGLAARAPCIRCRSCGREQDLLADRQPLTLDLATLTFVCRACRPKQTISRWLVCARPECRKNFRRQVPINEGVDHLRFCTDACRKQHYRVERRCVFCDKVITKRARYKVHCSRECYKQGKIGQPNPHYRPSQAELSILKEWQKGVRGVRPLARASGSSVNTVQKLIKAGKLTASTASV